MAFVLICVAIILEPLIDDIASRFSDLAVDLLLEKVFLSILLPLELENYLLGSLHHGWLGRRLQKHV